MSLARRRDYHQTLEYAGVMELGGWRSVAVPGAFVYVHRTRDHAFAKMQRPTRLDVDALVELEAGQELDELHIEPASEMVVARAGTTETLHYEPATHAAYVDRCQAFGLREVGAKWAHSKTLGFELEASQDALLAALARKPRWEAKQAYADGITYRACSFDDATPAQLDEVAALHAVWQLRGHATYDDEFLTSIRRCFAASGSLVTAYDANGPVAALYVLFVDRVAIYFYSFSSPAARGGYAGTGLVLEAARLGRERGCDLIDLCGCWDDRYPDQHVDWQGFTAFKEKFATTTVCYPPTFVFDGA